MAKLYNRIADTVKGAGSTLKTYGEVAINNIKNSQLEKKLVNIYKNRLPSTIINPKAYKEIDRLAKNKDFKGIRDYTKSQLQKMLKQTQGTGSEGYIQKQLDNF